MTHMRVSAVRIPLHIDCVLLDAGVRERALLRRLTENNQAHRRSPFTIPRWTLIHSQLKVF